MARAQRTLKMDGVMTPGSITAEWLTDLLRSDGALKSAKVVAVESARIGSGLVGQNLRFTLRYDREDTGAPRSLVGKFPSPEAKSRAAAKALRTYEREVGFYLDLASSVRIRAPHCHSGAISEDRESFHLILEDLAPAAPGDQIRGCDLREAAAAIVELAGLHAPRWNDSALNDLEWLARPNEENNAMLRVMYGGCWDGFVRAYGEVLNAEALAFGERFGANLQIWQDGWSAPPCVTHGDFRLDNMMFESKGGKVKVTTVDWQTVAAAPGVMDAAYFLGNGLLLSDRRAHERALIERYHGALVERGVSKYSFKDCLRDYRRATMYGIVMTVVASQVVEVDERGREMFAAMAQRHFVHAMDHDGAEFFT